MLEAKVIWLAVAGAVVIGLIAYMALRRGDVGQGRFFGDQSYHFQTLRAMNDVASDGADTAEVLETIKKIRAGDAQGWFRAWSDSGDRVTRLAAATTDRIAKGCARITIIGRRNFFYLCMTPNGLYQRPRTFNRFTPALMRWVSCFSGSRCPMARAII